MSTRRFGKAGSLGKAAVAMVAVITAGTGCVSVSTGSGHAVQASPRSAGASASALPTGQLVQAAINDVERYWKTEFPKLSGNAPFKPIQGGRFPYTQSKPPPACGSQPGQYQPNAFYCPDGDFIAWDAQTLVPQLQSQYGPLLVGVVFAHEYGHAIQARLNLTDQPTIVMEQQADCFAGSWMADPGTRNNPAFGGVTPAALDRTVAGLLSLRDQPGVSAQNQQAHGNAFDRIRALQEGYEQGAAHCATYRANNIPVTEVPFTNQQEAATGGDLPYDQTVTDVTADEQSYWGRAYPQLSGQPWKQLTVNTFAADSPPSCPDKQVTTPSGSAFYCKSTDYVAYDNTQLGPTLYRNIGDNAVGMLLAELFAEAAQVRRGQSVQDRTGQLTVDCLAGSWTNDLLRRGSGNAITLSPGDLDEAVAALLVLGRSGQSADTSAFDRIAALRNGVLTGLSACH
jgi:predicted metalloprotease